MRLSPTWSGDGQFLGKENTKRMNKRKKVAWRKHRTKAKKAEEKRKAARFS